MDTFICLLSSKLYHLGIALWRSISQKVGAYQSQVLISSSMEKLQYLFRTSFEEQMFPLSK